MDGFERSAWTVGGVDPYGAFLQALVSFVLIASIVCFLVLQPVNRLMERLRTGPEVDSTTEQCPDRLSSIPGAARRCAFCAVEQPA